MGKIKLSILICTVTNRIDNFLPEIIKELQRQAENKPVEILYLGDNRKRTIGAKRNDLILLSQGEYCCFVDDDDKIDENYIELIFKAIEEKPDVIVFKAMYHDVNKGFQKEVLYSHEFLKDSETEEYFLRLPNHLMVFKIDVLQKCFFKEINFGEDADFAIQIKPLIKKQTMINKVLYYYNYDEKLSESRK
jgi:glycosyltransferase involved in cell wall biosynthesis